jgi:hypothetical protein
MKYIFRVDYHDRYEGKKHKDFWPKNNEAFGDTRARATRFKNELRDATYISMNQVDEAGNYLGTQIGTMNHQ